MNNMSNESIGGGKVLETNKKEGVSVRPMSPVALFVKRGMDITVALIAITVFAPVCLIIYIAIKMEDGGGAIFKQERIGKGGKPFTLYKFRSMVVNAEKESGPQLCAKKADKRLTRVGKFLREHHLDEFPQLWNLLKGDMSAVGYRPERQFYIDQIMEKNPDYVKLYAIRPGLFSEATLYNGYTATLDDMLCRLDFDLKYLKKRSLWLDLKIVFRTAIYILSGKKF